MLTNIPISQYNINFRDNPKEDYSEIYRKMEKITLRQEERIVPKTEPDAIKLFKNLFSFNKKKCCVQKHPQKGFFHKILRGIKLGLLEVGLVILAVYYTCKD